MYRVILAGNQTEATEYARQQDWRRSEYRYANRAATIRGLRVAEAHVLAGFAKRLDRHAILAELRHARHLDWIRPDEVIDTPAPVDLGEHGPELPLDYIPHQGYVAPEVPFDREAAKADLTAVLEAAGWPKDPDPQPETPSKSKPARKPRAPKPAPEPEPVVAAPDWFADMDVTSGSIEMSY